MTLCFPLIVVTSGCGDDDVPAKKPAASPSGAGKPVVADGPVIDEALPQCIAEWNDAVSAGESFASGLGSLDEVGVFVDRNPPVEGAVRVPVEPESCRIAIATDDGGVVLVRFDGDLGTNYAFTDTSTIPDALGGDDYNALLGKARRDPNATMFSNSGLISNAFRTRATIEAANAALQKFDFQVDPTRTQVSRSEKDRTWALVSMFDDKEPPTSVGVWVHEEDGKLKVIKASKKGGDVGPPGTPCDIDYSFSEGSCSPGFE